MTEEKEISNEIKQLVIKRIEADMPSNLKLSIGSYGSLTRESIIEHIKNNDKIGKKIIESHIRFLKAQASGELAKAMVSAQ